MLIAGRQLHLFQLDSRLTPSRQSALAVPPDSAMLTIEDVTRT